MMNMQEVLIAPCGMNCGVCSGYLAMENDLKNKGVGKVYVACCAGCRPRGKNCAFLKKRCDLLMSGRVQYCYECADYPCRNLQHLDKRYRTLFHMSMIENLTYIKENGMQKFLKKEEKKWRCPECGGTVCCHNGICFSCGLEKLKNKKKKHRWEDE